VRFHQMEGVMLKSTTIIVKTRKQNCERHFHDQKARVFIPPKLLQRSLHLTNKSEPTPVEHHLYGKSLKPNPEELIRQKDTSLVVKRTKQNINNWVKK
jgi:hypothetical protein